MAQLLVSVRSADEARTALAGGASIIDVKEPDHGSLGQAPWSVWRDVHTVASTARRSARPSESPRTGWAPIVQSLLEQAIGTDRIVGVLVDTWDKTRPIELDERWVSRSARLRQAGKLVALAGGLDCRSIASLRWIAPDIVAVRGAACVDGNRRSAIDLDRVAELSRVVRTFRP